MIKKVEVIVIGAGAAGMMCAIEAAKRGRQVLILDKANKAGKKILMSGGGRCNFTNLNVSADNFISHNPHFCKSALSRYTPQHFIDKVKQHNIPFHEKTLGQLFCDNKSKDICHMLLRECEAAGARIQLNTQIKCVTALSEHGFLITTLDQSIQCESLVIASGGLSIPTMGASPFGYHIAKQFGINVWPTRAGLVPFTLHQAEKEYLAQLSGVALDCEVTCRGQTFREAMLFTHRGLSGPAMLQISSYWQAGDRLAINFLPEQDLYELLISHQAQKPDIYLKRFLKQYFPSRVINLWLDGQYDNLPLGHFHRSQLQAIAAKFQHYQITPNGTEGYRTAEVTLGGVDCHAISSKTFAALAVPNLYFIGEVLDVTGWLGGYNFQWAWASGFAAGNVV